MAAFVLDASVTLAWCFDDEANVYADEVLDAMTRVTALAPSIWSLEVANVLVLARRRNRLSEARRASLIDNLRGLPVEVVTPHPARVFVSFAELALDQDLTVYDAAYLDLALREQLPLASLDRRLREAARRSGVSLLDQPPEAP